MQGVFINAMRNKIYLYFEEKIVADGLDKNDFTLSAGNVTAVEEVVNYADYYGENFEDSIGGSTQAYIALRVSGIDDDVRSLTLSYVGDKITDMSQNKNKADVFDETVRYAATAVESMYIGNDGKTLRIIVSGGPNISEFYLKHEWEYMKTLFVFTQDGTLVTAKNMDWSWWLGGARCTFTFDTALSDRLSVTLNPDTLPNWAYDMETAKQSNVSGNMSGKADTLNVSYSKNAKEFTITYKEGLVISDDGGLADGFVVTISGTEYKLRGYNTYESWKTDEKHVSHISLRNENDAYLQYIVGLLNSTNDVTLSYSLTHGDTLYNQPSDIGGALLPAFSAQTVTITN
jgi:hypothetical protein